MTALQEARLTRMERYVRTIDALTRKRDREVDATVRALMTLLAELRGRALDRLAGLPVRDGQIPAEALSVARGLADALSADFGRRLAALTQVGTARLYDHGLLFLPSALWSIGIGRQAPPALREAALPEDDPEDVDFRFPLIISSEQATAARELTGEYITAVTQAFREKLRQNILQNVTGQKSLAQLFADTRAMLSHEPGRTGNITYQAERIVRTELLRSFSEAAEVRSAELAASTPGMVKSWRSARDSRVRSDHRAADARYGAKPIPAAQMFVVGGDKMPAPRIGGSARNVIQCRCVRVDLNPSWFKDDAPPKPIFSPSIAPQRPAVPAPVKAEEPGPRGVPVGDAFSSIPSTPGIARKVREALEAINKTHGDGQLPQIPIETRPTGGALGQFRMFGASAHDIRIAGRGATDHQAFTVAHEVGHFLDHSGIGMRGRFASQESSNEAVFNAWRRAVNDSQAIKDLRKVRDTGLTSVEFANGTSRAVAANKPYVNYLLTPHETWARSYAQYVTIRNGSPAMRAELARWQARKPGEAHAASQWDDDDFEPIAKAIDAMFRQLGWMK